MYYYVWHNKIIHTEASICKQYITVVVAAAGGARSSALFTVYVQGYQIDLRGCVMINGRR